MKIIFISSSLYIIYVMMKKFARTRERERSWKFGAACLAGALLLSPFTMMLFEVKEYWSFSEVRNLEDQLMTLQQLTKV